MLEQAFYYTLTRIAWPLSLCWVVFACMKGYGGLADSFLSSPLWQPLSRLSYSAYIFHVYIQLVNDKRVRSPSYLSDYDMILDFQLHCADGLCDAHHFGSTLGSSRGHSLVSTSPKAKD
ncbi:O-acyltransferase like protein-like [Drosophila nasuta]|uniref:O-acyltransferase like protein-like n=1 Tax=Drosophila nasuta TaxID=42062 RepID=UPI00295E6689|nr:O-acyltransferase like protein-like [Drosophila nasuta]